MASGVDPLDHDRSVYGCALYDDTSDHPGGRRKADTRLLESILGKLPAGDSHTSDPDLTGVDDLYPFPECTGNGRTDPYGLLGRYLPLRNHMADGDIICLPCTGEVFQQYRKHHEECIPVPVFFGVVLITGLPLWTLLLNTQLFISMVPAWIFIGPGLIALLNSFLFHQCFRKYIPEEESGETGPEEEA